MKYQMPAPAELQSIGDSKPLGYTYADMCEAFDAGLEAASQAVINTGDTNSGYLVQAIRNLKETP